MSRKNKYQNIADEELYCPKFRESKKMRDETRFRCKLS